MGIVIEEKVSTLRDEMKVLGESLLELKDQCIGYGKTPMAEGEDPDIGEMIANVTLAYRHLEDSRMRLGKVLQAKAGGVNIFDTKKEELKDEAVSSDDEQDISKEEGE